MKNKNKQGLRLLNRVEKRLLFAVVSFLVRGVWGICIKNLYSIIFVFKRIFLFVVNKYIDELKR